MKVSSAVLQESYGKKTQKLAILPLVPEPVEENGKTQMITHQLLTNPNDNAVVVTLSSSWSKTKMGKQRY